MLNLLGQHLKASIVHNVNKTVAPLEKCMFVWGGGAVCC